MQRCLALRQPISGYSFVAASTVAIAFLSMGVWAHHMFAAGLGHGWDLAFGASSMLIAVPTGVKMFNWTSTIWRGAIRFTTSMWFAIAFLIAFTIGGLTFRSNWYVSTLNRNSTWRLCP